MGVQLCFQSHVPLPVSCPVGLCALVGLMVVSCRRRFILQEAAADPAPREVQICTDSQSALGRLREGPAAQRDVLAGGAWQWLRELTDRETYLSLQWVPDYAGLPGTRWLTGGARGCRPESRRSPRGPPVSKGQTAEARARGMEERIQSISFFQEVGPRRATPGERLGLSRRDGVDTAYSAPAIR